MEKLKGTFEEYRKRHSGLITIMTARIENMNRERMELYGIDRQDLEQIIEIAAWLAFETFDKSKGFTEGTYLGVVIRNRSTNYLYSQTLKRKAPVGIDIPEEISTNDNVARRVGAKIDFEIAMRNPCVRKFHEIYEEYDGPKDYAKAKGVSPATASLLGQNNKRIFLRSIKNAWPGFEK